MWLLVCKTCSLPFVMSKHIQVAATCVGLRITCPSCKQPSIYEPRDFRAEEVDGESAQKKPAERVETPHAAEQKPDGKRNRPA